MVRSKPRIVGFVGLCIACSWGTANPASALVPPDRLVAELVDQDATEVMIRQLTHHFDELMDAAGLDRSAVTLLLTDTQGMLNFCSKINVACDASNSAWEFSRSAEEGYIVFNLDRFPPKGTGGWATGFSDEVFLKRVMSEEVSHRKQWIDGMIAQSQYGGGTRFTYYDIELDASLKGNELLTKTGTHPEAIFDNWTRWYSKVQADKLHPSGPVYMEAVVNQMADLNKRFNANYELQRAKTLHKAVMLPGPLDFALVAVLSPTLYHLGGGSEEATRRIIYLAVENLAIEPAALVALKPIAAKALIKIGVRLASTGAKAALGSTLILIPVIVAETAAEDSIEEWFRTERLRAMGIDDLPQDAANVMGRVGEGWGDFWWNSSEERAIRGSAVYARIVANLERELGSWARSSLDRDLTEVEENILFEEAAKRAHRLFPDVMDRKIRKLRDIRNPDEAMAFARSTVLELNGSSEFRKRNRGRIHPAEILGIGLIALREDQAYAQSLEGILFKPITDALYDLRRDALGTFHAWGDVLWRWMTGQKPPPMTPQQALALALQRTLDENPIPD